MRVGDIVVVGCGFPDIARPLLALEKSSQLRWLGWADDNPELQDKSLCGRPVMGPVIKVLSDYPNCSFINTVALNAQRRLAMVQRLQPYAYRAKSVIHPDVDSQFCEIHPGAVISDRVYLEPNVTVGAGTMILPGCTIGHDSHIGSNCFIASGVHIGGNVEVGEYTWIGAGSVIHPGSRIGPFSVTSQGANIIVNSKNSRSLFYESPTSRRK